MEYQKSLSALLDKVEKKSQENEEQKFIAQEVISEFNDLGLFNVLLPSSLGFNQIKLKEFLKIVEQISSMDASTGWCFMCGATLNGAAGSFLPDEAIDHIFKKDKEHKNIIIAGQTAPKATVKMKNGDILISGKFKFASGSTHANWIICGFIHPENKEHYLALIPSDKVKLTGGWNTIGLAGTGSVDFSLDEYKLSKNFIFPHDSFIPLREKSYFSSGLVSIMLIGHVGVAVGLAKRALKEIKRIVLDNKTSGDHINRQDFQIEFARETSRLKAIDAYLISTIDNVEIAISEKENLSKYIDAVRLASVFSTEECAKIIRFAYDRAGTHAIHVDSTLGRIFRDFHVANQHILIDITQYQKLGIKMLEQQ